MEGAQSKSPITASIPTAPLTPISAPTRTFPPLEGAPEPVGLVVLPVADMVEEAVLAAAEELVLAAGTSSALSVPHCWQL